MKPPKGDTPPSEGMELLERQANVVRTRLLRAVDALDARRHQVVEIGAQAKKMVKPAAISLFGAAALLGVSALALGLGLRRRRRRSLPGAVSRALRGLDVVPKPSLSWRVFESVAVSVMTFAATELVKQAAKNFIDGRLPSGRLMVGEALVDRRRRLAQGNAR
ncbi:MAG: hypothetical protein KF764_18265 [Labilithrix sp.]|nr:hypothetical protein [Labilithrix sp.]